MHIGKSSVGWVFSLHVEPDDPNFPSNLDDWKKLFEKYPNGITDEYGHTYSVEAMLSIILDRGVWTRERQLYADHGRNVEIGPRNLLRGKAGVSGTIGHGPNDETYSLCTGDFC